MFNPSIEAVNFQLPNTDRSEAGNIVKISQEEFDQSIRSQNIKSARDYKSNAHTLPTKHQIKYN
jgi:hypothetical protein